MRISDWSSDVCSSDLHVDLSPVAGTPAADGCHKSDLAHRIDTRRATPGIQLLEAGEATEDRTPEGHDRPLLEGRQMTDLMPPRPLRRSDDHIRAQGNHRKRSRSTEKRWQCTRALG